MNTTGEEDSHGSPLLLSQEVRRDQPTIPCPRLATGHFCKGSNKFLLLYNTQPRIMTMRALRQQIQLQKQAGLKVPLDPNRSIAPFRFSKLPDSDERLYLWQQMLVPRSPARAKITSSAYPRAPESVDESWQSTSLSAHGPSEDGKQRAHDADGHASTRADETDGLKSSFRHFARGARRFRSATVESRSSRAQSSLSGSDAQSEDSMRHRAATESFDQYPEEKTGEEDGNICNGHNSLRRDLSRSSLYSTEHSLASDNSSVISDTSKFSDPCQGTANVSDHFFFRPAEHHDGKGDTWNKQGTTFSSALRAFFFNSGENSESMEASEVDDLFERNHEFLEGGSVQLYGSEDLHSAAEDGTDRTRNSGSVSNTEEESRQRYRTLRGVAHVFEFEGPIQELFEPYWALRCHSVPHSETVEKRASGRNSGSSDNYDPDQSGYHNLNSAEDSQVEGCLWCAGRSGSESPLLPMADLRHLPSWFLSQASRFEETALPYQSKLLALVSAMVSLVSPVAQAQTMEKALDAKGDDFRELPLELFTNTRNNRPSKLFGTRSNKLQSDKDDNEGSRSCVEIEALLRNKRKENNCFQRYCLHRRLPEEIHQDVAWMLGFGTDTSIPDSVQSLLPRFADVWTAESDVDFFLSSVIGVMLQEAHGLAEISSPIDFWGTNDSSTANAKQQLYIENRTTPAVATVLSKLCSGSPLEGMFCRLQGDYMYEKSFSSEYPPSELWANHPLGLPLVQLLFRLLGERLDEQSLSVIAAGLLSAERSRECQAQSRNTDSDDERNHDREHGYLTVNIDDLESKSSRLSQTVFSRLRWINGCTLSVPISELLENQYLMDSEEIEESCRSLSYALHSPKRAVSITQHVRKARVSPQSSLTRIYAQAFAHSHGAKRFSLTGESPELPIRRPEPGNGDATFPFSKRSTEWMSSQEYESLASSHTDYTNELDNAVPSLFGGSISDISRHTLSRGPFYEHDAIEEGEQEGSQEGTPSSMEEGDVATAEPTFSTSVDHESSERLETEGDHSPSSIEESASVKNELTEAVSRMSETLCAEPLARGPINALSRCTPEVKDTVVVQDMPVKSTGEHTGWLEWRVKETGKQSKDLKETEVHLLDESTRDGAEFICRRYASKLGSYGLHQSSQLFRCLSSGDYTGFVQSKLQQQGSVRETPATSEVVTSRGRTAASGDSVSGASDNEHMMPFGFTSTRMKKVQSV